MTDKLAESYDVLEQKWDAALSAADAKAEIISNKLNKKLDNTQIMLEVAGEKIKSLAINAGEVIQDKAVEAQESMATSYENA